MPTNLNNMYGTFDTDEMLSLESLNEIRIPLITDKAGKPLTDKEEENNRLLEATGGHYHHFEFDDFLTNYVGDLGPYQLLIIILLIIPGCFLGAFSAMDMVFLSYTPEHKCKVDQDVANFTIDVAECSYTLLNNGTTSSESTTAVKCTEWVYDKKYFNETLVTEWNLVCDNALTITTIVSVMNLATMLSSLFSLVQDKYGRKKAFMLNLTVYLLSSCCTMYAPNPPIFAFLKFLSGTNCMWNICYCWALEFVGPSKRTLVAVLLSFLYACGNICIVFLAYFSSTWRQLAFMTSFPFIILFSYAFIIPESPRWLLTQGRTIESIKIMKRMASWQSAKSFVFKDIERQLSTNIYSPKRLFSAVSKNDNFGLCEFFRSKNLLWKTALITMANVLTNQLYTAVPFNVEHMGTDNYYLTYILQAAVEPPAVVINLLFLNRIGRVLPLAFFMMVGGTFCILTWPIENDSTWILTLITMVGRFLICAGIPIISQMGNELYPTVARGTGNSVSLVVLSLVSVTTQYILYMSNIWKSLPMIIMGSTTVLGGFAVLFLPETKDCPLPDTVEDAENQGAVGWTSFKSHFVKLFS